MTMLRNKVAEFICTHKMLGLPHYMCSRSGPFISNKTLIRMLSSYHLKPELLGQSSGGALGGSSQHCP